MVSGLQSTLLNPHHPRAVLLIMASVGLYAVQDVLIKVMPSEFSLVEIIFFRSLFGVFFIIPMIRREKHPHPFQTKHPILHFMRASATVLATFCFICALRLMPLAEAYAITYSAPIFMTLFAILFLKEKSTIQRWGTLFLGFIGVLVMFRPGPPEANPGSFIALAGGIFHAIAQLLTRKLSQEDSLSLIIVTFTGLSLIITGAMMPFYWQSYPIEVLLSLAVAGVLGCGAQYMMSQAFQIAPVASIAPFDYAALIWGMVFDAFLWSSFPDIYMISGVFLVILAGLFLIRSEQK